jgi:hypothetical protein
LLAPLPASTSATNAVAVMITSAFVSTVGAVAVTPVGTTTPPTSSITPGSLSLAKRPVVSVVVSSSFALMSANDVSALAESMPAPPMAIGSVYANAEKICGDDGRGGGEAERKKKNNRRGGSGAGREACGPERAIHLRCVRAHELTTNRNRRNRLSRAAPHVRGGCGRGAKGASVYRVRAVVREQSEGPENHEREGKPSGPRALHRCAGARVVESRRARKAACAKKQRKPMREAAQAAGRASPTTHPKRLASRHK